MSGAVACILMSVTVQGGAGLVKSQAMLKLGIHLRVLPCLRP